MTQVSRKGFVDKNGQQVAIVPKVPGATSGNLASFDENGNLQDSGIPAELVGEEIHVLEFEDGSYESRIDVGQLNRDDDELDGASIYGKDAIRLGVYGNSVFINGDNINNLQRALEDSAAPASGGNKLITNGQVYEALLNAGSIAQVNLKSTVVKDNSSYTYFGVKYGSSTEEEYWPEGDPEGMYGQLRLALGETENTVTPFKLTVKNGSDVVQAVVLGFVYYTKTSYTVEGNTSYNHNYKFCIGSFVYSLDISEYHGHFDFPTTAFVGNNSVNSL